MAKSVRRPVVVGYDLAAQSRRAVWWAGREASGRHLPLQLVHVLTWPFEKSIPIVVPGEGDVLEPLQDMLRRELGELVAGCREIDAELEVRDELRFGDPVETLSELSGDAELLVLGGPRIEVEMGVLGSTSAELLARRTGAPVVVVRGAGEQPDSRPVVVGVDGSQASRKAIGFAYDFASRHGNALVAVHAWSDLPLDLFTWVQHWELPWDEVRQEAMEVLASCLAGWSEHYPDVKVRRAISPEKPADALLREAQDAALVVVGSHGRGLFRRALLGSVSHAVVNRARCPVAVMRTG
ncbi:Nucleotide-binding universal stress protein, UspA family [Saccharopolyspora kobensis]|uniref:Nucleotide-binding universal stress protein, UspA family n=1 Tax=Saccharopolyspora kobensis TaxID=146035 RepID=A0A1H5V9Z0_9PSEU|nr:universal stress protein [Saccharopolyspora kobensis]SEF83257.1 Nucleotide-binding universal stress protein, UspA family [Saccharopolyspora kobensis]SFC64241.1 Nucleotide-binding universal stress protein, UspA family [Saccharopolyspora kobensis]